MFASHARLSGACGSFPDYEDTVQYRSVLVSKLPNLSGFNPAGAILDKHKFGLVAKDATLT